MPGSLKILRSDPLRAANYAAVAIVITLAFGCAGSGESGRSASTENSFPEFLAKHEPTFNPSKYNPDIDKITVQENTLYSALHSATVSAVAQPETIPGFRIQVLLTQEIGEAMSVRDSLAGAFQDELIYVVYDSPYYKIRIGNYPERTFANPLLKQLTRMGYRDAWIVPDNVLKNPPLKLPDRQIEPKNPLQNKN